MCNMKGMITLLLLLRGGEVRFKGTCVFHHLTRSLEVSCRATGHDHGADRDHEAGNFILALV